MKAVVNSAIVIFLMAACAEKDQFNVSGTILSEGKPVEGAVVSVDNVGNWSTKTGINGTFSINGVSEGSHRLAATKTNSNDSFQNQEIDLVVNGNINLDDLRLPKPTSLKLLQEPEASTAALFWNKTDADNYREYKLYRHTKPGLDETTGTLIYATVSRSDTTFSDSDLISSGNYYYRVYVMNDFGKVGGSNVLQLKTKSANLIPNGNFELNVNPSEHWSITRGAYGTYMSTNIDTEKKEGSRCFYNQNDLAYTNGNINTYSLLKLIKSVDIAKSKAYKLSAWVRISGQRGDVGGLRIHVKTDDEVHASLAPSAPNGASVTDTGWVYYSTNFSLSEPKSVTVQIYIPFQYVYIDDLQLIPQE